MPNKFSRNRDRNDNPLNDLGGKLLENLENKNVDEIIKTMENYLKNWKSKSAIKSHQIRKIYSIINNIDDKNKILAKARIAYSNKNIKAKNFIKVLLKLIDKDVDDAKKFCEAFIGFGTFYGVIQRD